METYIINEYDVLRLKTDLQNQNKIINHINIADIVNAAVVVNFHDQQL